MLLSHLAAALAFLTLEASALPTINLDLPSLPFNPLQVFQPTEPGKPVDSHNSCCSALRTVGQQFPIVPIAFCSNIMKQPPPPLPDYPTTTTASKDSYAPKATTSANKGYIHTHAHTTTTTAPTTKPYKTYDDGDTPTSTSTTSHPTPALASPTLGGPILPRIIEPPFPFTPPGDQADIPLPPRGVASSLGQCMQIDIDAACHCLMMAEYQPEIELQGEPDVLP